MEKRSMISQTFDFSFDYLKAKMSALIRIGYIKSCDFF